MQTSVQKFPQCDLQDVGVERLNLSNVAARQELRDLLVTLDLPGVTPDF